MKLSEAIVMLSEEHGVDLRKLQADAARVIEVEPKLVELSEANATLTTTNATLTSENTTLKGKVDAAEKAQADAKFSELAKKGMSDGKITKAFADGKFKEMYEGMGAEFCETFLSEAPKVVDISEPTGGAGGSKSGDKPADIQLNELTLARAKKDEIDYSDAAELVLSENPDLAKAYEAMGA